MDDKYAFRVELNSKHFEYLFERSELSVLTALISLLPSLQPPILTYVSDEARHISNEPIVFSRSNYTGGLSSRRYDGAQHGMQKQELNEAQSWCGSFGAHSTFIGSAVSLWFVRIRFIIVAVLPVFLRVTRYNWNITCGQEMGCSPVVMRSVWFTLMILVNAVLVYFYIIALENEKVNPQNITWCQKKTMDQLKPPNSLDFEGNLAENWRTWIQKFDLYLIATGIAEKSDKVKCATFLHVAGDDAIKVFNTMDFDDDVDDFEVLKEKFREYCEPRKNISYLRHMFFTRAQGPNETIDAYVTDLKNKAKDCEFGRLNDDLIKDRIVCGVNNDTVRARLLRETDLNLAKAVDICRANEITQSHLKVLHEEAEVAVNKITKTKSARQVNIKHTRKEKDECTRCGYRFLRLPFGIVSAPEVFQKCIAQRLEGLDGVVNIVDDILVWGEDMEQHDKRLRKLLDRIRDINLKLNKTKCKIRMTEVSYVGHILTAEGLKPDNGKVRAIQNMPEPQDKAALMRFLGLLQYLSKFILNMSDLSAPLRILLEGDVAWHWESEQQKSFERLKSLVSNTPVLKYFDVNKEIMLSVDASAEGLGAVLLQEGHPVAFGSRSLTECQKRYAQIEKELLAIVYGCEKFHQYVYGKTVQVETDHKPLETVFKKSLQKAPPRLQRMLMRLQLYDIRVSYKPGKELYIADTLSRAYLKEQVESLLEDELQVHTLLVCLPISKEKQETFRTATIQDAELQQVVNVVQSGWPDDIVKSSQVTFIYIPPLTIQNCDKAAVQY
ncbi:Retrovirus-related Pol polyprotein from transposon 17.6 [Labeo rohita]|uniref:ribonuclease H n=1 Tax=Labeo rohita TaxID=84645 RepID=A0ABQ8MVB8_LABRO|nr:Retrovirus-related Pol polyprotein from transposon 17.6 [Labeo rohita]